MEEWGEWGKGVAQAVGLWFLGVFIALGQILASAERVTRRIVLGRAVTNGGFAMGAGMALLLFPDVPPLAIIGLAATFASLGTSALEKALQRLLSKGS